MIDKNWKKELGVSQTLAYPGLNRVGHELKKSPEVVGAAPMPLQKPFSCFKVPLNSGRFSRFLKIAITFWALDSGMALKAKTITIKGVKMGRHCLMASGGLYCFAQIQRKRVDSSWGQFF